MSIIQLRNIEHLKIFIYNNNILKSEMLSDNIFGVKNILKILFDVIDNIIKSDNIEIKKIINLYFVILIS